MSHKKHPNHEMESAETIEVKAKMSTDLSEMEKVVTELQTALDEAQKKVDENWQTALRFRADIENVRRQADKDVANAQKYSLEKFANALLPILDSLERGVANIKPEDIKADERYKSLAEGMQLTLRMFLDTLSKFNIVMVDPLGEPFDPQWHEAMVMQPSADAAPGTVLTVIQRGYCLNDRLLRPARVIVAKEA